MIWWWMLRISYNIFKRLCLHLLVWTNSNKKDNYVMCSLLLSNEEVILKQTSRVSWLYLGDNNNRYLFNSCKNRWKLNKLVALEYDQGTIYNSHRNIQIFLSIIFKSLWGSASTVAPFDSSISLPRLSDGQNYCDDVLITLKRIAKNKIPDPDGFMPEFYNAAWDVVGLDVTNDRRSFEYISL